MTGCRPDEHCFVNTPLNTLNTPCCSSQQKLDTPISIIRQPKARNYPCTASVSDIRENKPDAVH